MLDILLKIYWYINEREIFNKIYSVQIDVFQSVCLVAQSCLTFGIPMNCRSPWVFQARVLSDCHALLHGSSQLGIEPRFQIKGGLHYLELIRETHEKKISPPMKRKLYKST